MQVGNCCHQPRGPVVGWYAIQQDYNMLMDAVPTSRLEDLFSFYQTTRHVRGAFGDNKRYRGDLRQ